FSSPIRLPPRSPPFPYTTLFRSLQIKLNDPRVSQIEIFLGFKDGLMSIAMGAKPVAVIVKITLVLYPKPLGDALLDNTVDDRGEDRKSTRLNSSHVKISYAVFCL